MIADDIKKIGLPIENPSPNTCLIITSAFEWLLQNTTIDFDIKDLDSIEILPASTKLFVLKFVEVMELGTGVSSESIEGMSQSFSAEEKGSLIWQYARELLGDTLRSEVKVFRAANKWS